VLLTVVVNKIASTTCLASGASEISLYISISVAVLGALLYQTFGLYGNTEEKMHHRVLARFWPKAFSMLLAALGAASTVANLASAEDRDMTSITATWIGHGALLVSLLMTFVAAFVAMKVYNMMEQLFTRFEHELFTRFDYGYLQI
jgi:hypothetical protein